VEDGLFIATRGYDNAGRVTSVTNGTLDTTGYTLSADGRRTAISRNGQSETYGYDNARQVTSASIPLSGGSRADAYQYDAAGNRSSATSSGAGVSPASLFNYTTNNVNEYTAISGGGFQPPSPSHDNNGNSLILPRPDGTALNITWNIHNEQISATNGAGDTATYQYDALGRRTKRSETISSVTTHTWFFTNGWNVELEHDGANYTQRMTWGLDLSQSLQGAGGVGGLVMVENLTSGTAVPHFPTYDGNGNITAWVNGGGSVVARQRYDAFGNIIDQTGTAPSNYGFSTKPLEKVTGLLYYGYRYYDPVTGRWPSRDPIEERGGLNLYEFVGNSSIFRIDIWGLQSWTPYPGVGLAPQPTPQPTPPQITPPDPTISSNFDDCYWTNSKRPDRIVGADYYTLWDHNLPWINNPRHARVHWENICGDGEFLVSVRNIVNPSGSGIGVDLHDNSADMGIQSRYFFGVMLKGNYPIDWYKKRLDALNGSRAEFRCCKLSCKLYLGVSS
jgi:RHS repeat-associated protein